MITEYKKSNSIKFSTLMTLIEKLESKVYPKKILSLDGGGIRGTLTLGILEKIEILVKEKYGEQTSLGDYYDLICGTSTGAIIACGLSLGKSVKEITQLYLKLGEYIFNRGRKYKIIPGKWTKLRSLLRENYSSDKFEMYLRNILGDIMIGDQDLIKCGLAINTKRADTYSLWTIVNHPKSKYYEANKHLKLWELCRAFGAAPYYFRPKTLQMQTRSGGLFLASFIDGGISLANNPAMISFLTSQVGTFGFKWKNGVENLTITSIGTGNGIQKEKPKNLEKYRAINCAPKLSELFMKDAIEMNQILMNSFGKNEGPTYFTDSQFTDPDNQYPPRFHIDSPLLPFDRHNVYLLREKLIEIGIQLSQSQVESLPEMDHFENMEILLEIGQKYAKHNRFSIV